MFDRLLRPIIDKPLDSLAHVLAKEGITASFLSWGGFLCGMTGAVCLVFHFYWAGFIFFLINRIADGLDGAVARAEKALGYGKGPTDAGGFLDIVLDFFVYAAVPFFFAVGHPEQALAATFLIYSFIGSGGSFLAYAIIAEKRGRAATANGKKSFFHSIGLCEGTETIVALSLIFLFPQAFAMIAYIFGVLCWITACVRIWIGLREFG